MRSLHVIVVALAVSVCPLVAYAGGPSPTPAPSASAPSSPPAPETADSLYNQGNDAYDRGDLGLAFELYTGAFKLRPSYDIARNLGLVELKLGRYREAISHFSYSLALYPSNRADTKRQVVEWLEQAKQQVGKLRLRVEPDTAECRAGGVTVTRDELEDEVLVDPGDVKVECSAPGHRAGRRTVSVEKGRTAAVTLQLEAEPRGPGPGPGPAGGGARMTIVWVGSATAIGSLGVGAVTGVLSLVRASEGDALLADLRKTSGRESPCVAPGESRCAELLALRGEQDAFGNVAFWTLLAGGLAGAATGTYWFLTHAREPAPPPPKVGLAPIVTPGAAGVVISGSF